MARDLVVEHDASGFCGAIITWENAMVVLEDRKGLRRSFPYGTGFSIDSRAIELVRPAPQAPGVLYTASGSRAGRDAARVALPSRIYVEGRHDAELVEKIWGADLRHVGVVVEFLGGIDDLKAIVDDFAPAEGRRLGVLVDHLVPGSKETRIAETVTSGQHGDFVMITGHEFIDIWHAIKPATLGRSSWPTIPRDVDFKRGTLKAMGLPYRDQTDVPRAWQAMLARVSSYRDLEPAFNREVERLIDFVTQDHVSD